MLQDVWGGSSYICIFTRRLVTRVTLLDSETQRSVWKIPWKNCALRPVLQQGWAAPLIFSLLLTKQTYGKASFWVLTEPLFLAVGPRADGFYLWRLCLCAAWHRAGVKPQWERPHWTLRRRRQDGSRDYSFNTYLNSFFWPVTVPGTGYSWINKQG